MSKSPLLLRIAFAGAAVCLVSSGLSAQDPGSGAIKGDGSVQGSTTVGTLYAFKAIEMTQLYSSSLCTGDAMTYPASKFSVPTVANGFAYVGGQGPLQHGPEQLELGYVLHFWRPHSNEELLEA